MAAQASLERHSPSEEMFERSASAVPGVFQSVPLFTTFGGLSSSLWHLWELALTGEPILILAPTPDSCSRAVLGIVSMIAPLRYCGDYRPYFTIHEPDFGAISKLSEITLALMNSVVRLEGHQQARSR